MMHRCRKEWVDQYNTSIGGTANNVDTLLKFFETYKKIDTSKLSLVPILRKIAMGCSISNVTKRSGDSSDNSK